MAEKKSEKPWGLLRIELPQFLLFPPPFQTHTGLTFGLTLNTNFLVFLLQSALQMANANS